MRRGYRLQFCQLDNQVNEIDQPVINLIEDALIAWRTKQTRARGNVSLNKFAEHIGAGRSLLSMWLLGERPVTDEYRKTIAKPIADLVGPHACEILGVTPPDPLLQSINSRWTRIPADKQQKLAELAERYEDEALKNGSKNASKQRKAATS